MYAVGATLANELFIIGTQGAPLEGRMLTRDAALRLRLKSAKAIVSINFIITIIIKEGVKKVKPLFLRYTLLVCNI